MPSVACGTFRLNYSDVGVGDQVILLLHGFPLDHTMWVYQTEALRERYRVLALDFRGFGQSRGGEEGVSLADYADDCARLLDHLGIRQPIALCGLSMGGYVAWQFWRRHAARLGRLILCDTRAQADTEEVARGRQRMAYEVLAQGTAGVAESMLPRLMSGPTFERFPDRVAKLRTVMEQARPEAIAAAQRAMATRVDSRAWLPQIQCPTLGICGAEDEISRSSEMADWLADIPRSRFVEVPDAGHLSPYENEVVVNESILDFLAETSVA